MASWRRWKLAWLAGMPSSRAMSAARTGPEADSSSRIAGADRVGDRPQHARVAQGLGLGHGGSLPELRTHYCATSRAQHMVRTCPDTASSRRNRDFTVLWIGDTVSELGSALSMFVFPLIAYALSGSAITAALVEAAYLGGLCATLLPAGVLADRRRPQADHARLQRHRLRGVHLARGRGRDSAASRSPTSSAVALVAGVAAGAFNPAQTLGDPVGRAHRGPADRAQPEPGPPARRLAARRTARRVRCTPSRGGCRSPSTRSPSRSRASTVSRVRTDLSAPHRRREPLRRQLAEGFRFIWRAPVLPHADGLVVADQPGDQRDLLRRSSCGWSPRACPPRRSAWSRWPRASAASSAPRWRRA